MKLPKFLTDVLTQSDSTTFEAVRVGGLLSLVILDGFTGWTVYTSGHFDPLAYASACATILLAMAGGAAVKRKADAPPDAS